MPDCDSAAYLSVLQRGGQQAAEDDRALRAAERGRVGGPGAAAVQQRPAQRAVPLPCTTHPQAPSAAGSCCGNSHNSSLHTSRQLACRCKMLGTPVQRETCMHGGVATISPRALEKAARSAKVLWWQAAHTACSAGPSFALMLASSCAATLLSCPLPGQGPLPTSQTTHACRQTSCLSPAPTTACKGAVGCLHAA